MPTHFTLLASLSALAGGLLALAALGAVLLALRRCPRVVPSSASSLLLGALGLAGAAHAVAPAAGVIEAIAMCLAAVLAWCGVAILWLAPPPEPQLLDVALGVCGDGVVIATTDSACVEIVYSNPAFEDLTGYTNEEAMGQSPSILVDEMDSLALVREALRGTESVRVEVPGRHKDGTRVWTEWQIVPVTDTGGRHTHSVAVLRDTTERRRAESALQASEARFRGLFEQAADGIFVLDRTGRIVDANPQACQTVGYERAELLAQKLADIGESSAPSGIPLWETGTEESTFRRKDGSTVAVEIRCAVSENAGQRFTLAMVRDVTRRRRAEQALREREELLRNIINHIPCGVFWKDRDSVYLGCNEQVARDHGLDSAEQVLGRNDFDISPDPGDAEFYRECDREVMESGRLLANLEESLRRPDGTRAALLTSKVPLRDTHGRVVGVLGTYTDITGLKRLQEQLRHAQKMEAVGQLAGGIAHDFNNLLTVIRGNADLLRPAANTSGPAALLDDLVLAADRATALIRQLLAFSRRLPARVEVLDLNEIVTALAPLLRRLLGERVVLSIAVAGEPVAIRADRSHLEQVVMNLTVNARDAMPDGGNLSVYTEAIARSTPDGSVRFARLAITDTGTGMTDEVKAHIFEPFFTTKGQDKGTGLGLATVFGIVEQSGGHIEVESAPGAGTTFRVDLPWWDGVASGTLLTPSPQTESGQPVGGPVSVLLVEDQEAVRKFARLALQSQGHGVIEAESGEAALELVDGGAAFDVLLTDLSMPGIDGHELALRLRARRPDTAVVLMSGYAADSDLTTQLERSVFLQKPFPPADLFAALKQALRLMERGRSHAVEVPSRAGPPLTSDESPILQVNGR